jgi:hypothetical protein
MLLLATIVCPLVSAAPSETDRLIVRDWRARLAELRDLDSKLEGGLVGGSLTELGRVGFVFERAGRSASRWLHRDDREFVTAAVNGQQEEEIEHNLPAIINYVRLSATASPMVLYVSSRSSSLGGRYGLETMVRVEKAVADFRRRQAARVRNGEILATNVLTKANLASLGDPAIYRELRQAFRDGERRYRLVNDLTGFGLFAACLLMVAMTTLVVRRRAAAAYRMPSIVVCFE